MNKLFKVYIGSLLMVLLFCANCYSLPQSEKQINDLEKVRYKHALEGVQLDALIEQVRHAKDLIEDAGAEVAFKEFRVKGSKWNNGIMDIFVIETDKNFIHAANVEKNMDINNGCVVVSPTKENVGKKAFDMKHVNGKPVAHYAKKKQHENKIVNWFTIMVEEIGFKTPMHFAFAIAKGPKDKRYVVTASMSNAAMERKFVEASVDLASELLQIAGKSMYPVFYKKNSLFYYKGSDIFIISDKGKVLVAPNKRSAINKNICTIAEEDLYKKICNMVKTKQIKDQMWFTFKVKKPGSKKYIKKSAFLREIKTPDGTLIVGSEILHLK